MIQVNRIYLIFNRLVTKKFLVDTSDAKLQKKIIFRLFVLKLHIYTEVQSKLKYKFLFYKGLNNIR